MELIERPDLNAVKYLYSISYDDFKNNCIHKAEINGEKKPTIKDMKTKYSILKDFCKTNLKTKGVTKRIYAYSQTTPAGLGGRLFCGSSLQGISGTYRGLLMRGIGTDIDMKNCHPVILRYICKKHNFPCPHLEYYVNHRDECLYEFPTKAIGKNAYLVATNNDKRVSGSFLPKHFKDYDKEMKDIQKRLIEEPEYRKLQETVPEYKQTLNYNGCVINRILCYYENIILQHALHVLNSKGIEVAILMFDGLMVYGDYYNDMTLLKEITDYVTEKMPDLNMCWDYKVHDDSLQIPEEFDMEDTVTSSYLQVKEEFQKAHAKIIYKSAFIVENDNDVIIKSKSEMLVSYQHLKFQIMTDTGITNTPFMDMWLNDACMRIYNDIGVYPNPSKCPKNVYNMWRPFEMEQYTTPYTKNVVALDMFLNHIKILCNHEEPVYDYFKKWIAQMIQYPESKTIMPTLISSQGAGKGTLIELLRKMFGVKKVFETTHPSRDVWGSFNGIMVNAFLVNLDELSQKETFECEGMVKGLITNPAMTINNKGVNQFTISSYHRFIATTNNFNPVKTSEDDRRNLIISSSDELIGNKEYFSRMYEYLADVNAIRTCYDYFKGIPEMDKFGHIPIPKTEYQTNLKEMYQSPALMWLEDFTRRHINKEVVEKLGKDVFEDFCQWRTANGIQFDTNPSKLGVLLSNLKVNGGITKGQHTRLGKTRAFDIIKLKKHFNMGLLIELNDDNNTNNENIVYELQNVGLHTQVSVSYNGVQTYIDDDSVEC